jgi:hypothetical protein
MKKKIKSGIAIIILLVLVVVLITGLRVVEGGSLSWDMILLHIKLTFYSSILASIIVGVVALLAFWICKD